MGLYFSHLRTLPKDSFSELYEQTRISYILPLWRCDIKVWRTGAGEKLREHKDLLVIQAVVFFTTFSGRGASNIRIRHTHMQRQCAYVCVRSARAYVLQNLIRHRFVISDMGLIESCMPQV